MALSIRELAAALGVSKSQVGRDSQAGMPTHDLGAARAWRAENRDVSRTVDGRIDRPGDGNAQAGADGGVAAAAGAGSPKDEPASSDDGDAEILPTDTVEYRKARTEREQIRRDRERMELDRDRGKLIDATDAARMAFTSFRALRDQVFNLPARLAPQFAAMTDALQIEQLHDAELVAVFNNFSDKRLLVEQSDDDDDDPD
jgi:hypothetical protein